MCVVVKLEKGSWRGERKILKKKANGIPVKAEEGTLWEAVTWRGQ